MKLGIVTYNIARDWDLPTIIERLDQLGFEGVELRTTHGHGVEPSLTSAEREQVRQRFADSPVELAGIGTACEFHSDDPALVRKNLDEAKRFIRLAHDVGAPGIKVRPNRVPEGRPLDATLAQIGQALQELGEDGDDFGVEIRLEVHGNITQDLVNIATIMSHAPSPNVKVCWNSNPTDLVEGSIARTFPLVADRIGLAHLRDLTDEAYPWRDLFARLDAAGFEGYTLAEIPESSDPMRVLAYFRPLWIAFQSMAQARPPGQAERPK